MHVCVAITRHLNQKCLSMKCRYVHVSACICWYCVSICMYLLRVCERLFSKGHLRLCWASGVLQSPGTAAAPRAPPPGAAARHSVGAGIRQPLVQFLHHHVGRDPAAPCSTSTRPGSCSPLRLFYINTWAIMMIWPTDIGGHGALKKYINVFIM